MFNIYHVSPHETSDPNEFVTEVCYPVKKKKKTRTRRSTSAACPDLGDLARKVEQLYDGVC